MLPVMNSKTWSAEALTTFFWLLIIRLAQVWQALPFTLELKVTWKSFGEFFFSNFLNSQQGQAPGLPIPLQLIAPNSSSVTLRLNNWPDNGCPILYFVVQYRAISDEGEDPWTLVSNALKPQRRFQITSLRSSTLYQLKMEAHNVAGSTNADFTFVTLTKDGGEWKKLNSRNFITTKIFLFVIKTLLHPKSNTAATDLNFSTMMLRLLSLP